MTAGASIPQPRADHVDEVVRILGNGLTVALIAVDCWAVHTTWTSGRAAEEMRAAGEFTIAPVREETEGAGLIRFLRVDDTRDHGGAVDEIARPITADMVVSTRLSLLEALTRLRDQPCLFTSKEGEVGVRGIFTHSDLAQPAVSMLVLALILSLEAAIDAYVKCEHADWADERGGLISRGRVDRARSVFADRTKRNTQIDLLSCLMIEDRTELVCRIEALRCALGLPSRSGGEAWAEGLKALRNTLAHGGNLLHVHPEPTDAIDRVKRLAVEARALWALSDRSAK